MKPQVNAQSIHNGCLYPFEGLSPKQGYPSIADFIVESGRGAKGRGVMALRHYQRITRMCRVSGQLIHTPQLHSVQLAAGIHAYDPYFCGRLRHSCDPNVFLDMSELWLWALQDITPGSPLCMDYASTEACLLRQFACECDSPQCRGWITGHDEQPSAEGRLFLQQWHRHGFC
ncbi:SET domain-containing protein-lysine N-methyltransferase [Pseudomonas sp. RA_35y_Pfl2_P32]|uniref:SET domain-containing protein-lysine N-methyltransferase n=1 Tax=Pseudomonas sp. RA_35y_Pfl2_P32 TaxID=3088705 RepID=UPI0030DC28C5